MDHGVPDYQREDFNDYCRRQNETRSHETVDKQRAAMIPFIKFVRDVLYQLHDVGADEDDDYVLHDASHEYFGDAAKLTIGDYKRLHEATKHIEFVEE